jgi:kumamolisin
MFGNFLRRRLKVGLIVSSLLLSPSVLRAQTPADGVRVPGSTFASPGDDLQTTPNLALIDEKIPLTFALPLRDPNGAAQALREIYDPGSPNYKKFLTGEEFAARFGPTQADYDAVVDYVKSLGMTINQVFSNRLIVNATGTRKTIEKSFGIQMLKFQKADGSVYRTASDNPLVPAEIAGRLQGIYGIDTSLNVKPASAGSIRLLQSSPSIGIGTGQDGYLSPADIKKAYGLTTAGADGAGQILGLVEFDDYAASNIDAYASNYGLASVPLTKIQVGGTRSPSGGDGQIEAELDIEMMMSLAPGAEGIRIYEAPTTNYSNILSLLAAMIDEPASTRPTSISTSWSIAENASNSSVKAIMDQENVLYMQMAAQGQSFYASSGDHGAYPNSHTCSAAVTNPASQPYVTSVGGTTLTLNESKEYGSETTWWESGTSCSDTLWAGAGGNSAYWSAPFYQTGLSPSEGTAGKRTVPDVALNSGAEYSFYSLGRFTSAGGTSAAAPLWAAFNALVNQALAASGKPPLGFPSPALYSIAESADYGSNFHDIADNSKNGSATDAGFHALTGYDLTTGWGTPKMDALLASLQTTADLTPPEVWIGLGTDYEIAVPSVIDTNYNGGQAFNYYGASYIEILTQDGSSGVNGVTIEDAADTGLNYNYAFGAKQINLGTYDAPDWQDAALPIAYTTHPLREFFVKKAAGASGLEFSVSDQAGNKGTPTLRDIGAFSFASKAQPQRRTFSLVEKGQGRFSIMASGGDVRNVSLFVNGESVAVGDVPAGDVKVIDLRSRLRNGDQNEVTVTAEGDAGSQATMMVSSAMLMNPDRANLPPSAGEGATPGSVDPNAPAATNPSPGDMNRSGSLDVTDVVALLRIVAGLDVPTALQRAASDVNQDEAVNVADVTALIKKVTGR